MRSERTPVGGTFITIFLKHYLFVTEKTKRLAHVTHGPKAFVTEKTLCITNRRLTLATSRRLQSFTVIDKTKRLAHVIHEPKAFVLKMQDNQILAFSHSQHSESRKHT